METLSSLCSSLLVSRSGLEKVGKKTPPFHADAVLGAATSKVHYRWTKYLRDCLAYLVQYLYGIRKLVQALGPDALETYPLTGYLEEAAIRRVEATEILDES